MKICFMARPNYDRLSAYLYNTLKKRLGDEFDAGFITCNLNETEFTKALTRSNNIYQINSFIEKHWDELSLEKLVEYEEKFNCAPMWKYIYTDRFLISTPYDYTIKIATGLFMFFDEVFKDKSYEYYYDESVSTLLSYSAYIVCTHYGTQFISQMVGRTDVKTSHYFVTDQFQNNALLKQTNDYTTEELEKADIFLSNFEKEDIKKTSAVFAVQEPKLQLYYLKAFCMQRFNKLYNDKYDYINYKKYNSTLDNFKFYFRYKKMKKHIQETDFSRKYVYFPLHYQPEASTIVCAQKYEKQWTFIDHLAKSLPTDTMLYIKEHYVFLGHKPTEFYETLSKYPNVVLLSPWENGKKLIQNAQAVVTMTGTAGWEAMLLRKPVILGGHIFFDNAPGIMRTDDIYQNYIPLMQSWKKPERDETIKYLCAYFRSLRKGHMYAAVDDCYTDKNINDLTDSLIEEIGSLK